MILQEYDMTVTNKRGALKTNTDCLSCFSKDAPNYKPILPAWNKRDYNISLATVFAFMGTEQLDDDDQLTQLEFWEDKVVLHFLKIHKYQEELTPLSKNRVYRRAEEFRWSSHNLYKIQKYGSHMLVVPLK